MKKIVSFIGEFTDVKGEGLISVIRNLKEKLEKCGYEVLINQNKGLKHIHSNGIFFALQNYKILKESYFSLYGNIDENFYLMLRNHIIYYLYFNNKHYGVLRTLKHDFFTLLSGIMPLFLKRLILKRAKLVIVPTEYLKNKLSLPNVKVIPIGIDTEKFRKIKRPSKTFTVGFFGHNSPLKGIEEFIKAAKILKNEEIKFKMFLTKYSEKTKEYANKNNNKIEISGFVTDLVKEYNECDVIVLPYQTPTAAIAIPLTMIEAMSCEVPIITTNLANIKEITGQSVLHVSKFSPRQIAEKILFLKQNPSIRSELGRKGRDRVVEKYNQNKTSEEYLKIYLSS